MAPTGEHRPSAMSRIVYSSNPNGKVWNAGRSGITAASSTYRMHPRHTADASAISM